MMNINNGRVISGLAAATWRAEKKRNALTIFAIFLTTFLIASVLSIGAGYWSAISLRQLRMTGMDYDISLPEPREDQVEAVRAMDNVSCAGVSIKCAIVTQYQDAVLDKMQLYYIDETCWEKQCIPALEFYEGTYPQAENELMLSTAALHTLGIEDPAVGDKITLGYYTLSDDSSGETVTQTFVLSGWYRDYSGSSRGYVSKAFQEASGVTQTDFTKGELFIKLKNPLYSEKEIAEMQKSLKLDNRQLISADSYTISMFLNTSICLAGLLLMVFFSGYLFIYNTLYISISRNIRYYGQLKTLGMTSLQLRRMIRREALWNSALGILPGLAVSALTADRLIRGVLTSMHTGLDADLAAAPSPLIYAAAGLFALLTNLIGSRKPAQIAETCSPVEALRFTPTLAESHRHGRKSGRTNTDAHHSRPADLSLALARQNVFRDRKQAAVILLSFTIALTIFLSINVLIKEHDARSVLNAVSSEDISFTNNTTLEENLPLITEEKVEQLRQTPGVKAVRKVISAGIVVPYQPGVFDRYYEVLCGSRYSPGQYEELIQDYRDNPENLLYTTRLNTVGEEGFDLLNASVGNTLDRDAFFNGQTAVACNVWASLTAGDWTSANAQMLGKDVTFSLEDGTSHTVTIAAVSTNKPGYFAGGYTPDLIVSETLAETLMKEPYIEKVCVEYEKPFSADTEQRVKAVFAGEKNIGSDSKLENYEEIHETERQIRTLGLSLGLIVALLALLNYCNMMAASVQNRSREFATLESIGMTSRQARRILSIEGAGYAILSIAASLLLGTPVSVAVFRGTNQYAKLTYRFPFSATAVLYLAVLALCMTVPVVLYEKSQSESVIEHLRQTD